MIANPKPRLQAAAGSSQAGDSRQISGRPVTAVGSASALIDDVEVNHVPEPGTAALLAAGLGWLGLRVRRRSR